MLAIDYAAAMSNGIHPYLSVSSLSSSRLKGMANIWKIQWSVKLLLLG